MSPIRNGRGVSERKYNMNTKGKIDFTKTDNIQFIEEVAREISKEDKNWQWEDSVPYGSTTATMFGGCDKEDEMTEEEAERFGETEDCPFWENRYKEENA